MEYSRKLDLNQLLKKKSYFLLGPRSTGKSYWIRKTLGDDVLKINLNNTDTYLRLSEQPALLNEMVALKKSKRVVIDEIQKIPSLLDEVHNLIEERQVIFLLTGSSARSLKRQHANMLGGRAGHVQMFPLSYSEIPDFNLEKYLNVGGLPRIYDSEEPQVEFDAYISTYLDEEIKAEAHIRNLLPFHRFLKAAVLNNSQLLNYSNISNDSGVPMSTVREYYSLLQDTLLGFVLEPWLESKKRKAIQTAKFYFFDCGICRELQGLKKIERNTSNWGSAFEQFICLEIKAYLNYSLKKKNFNFWRSVNKQEVDFVIDDSIAIETKATKKLQEKHFAGLKALKEEGLLKSFYIVSEDPLERKTDEGFACLHWKSFLEKLWAGKII